MSTIHSYLTPAVHTAQSPAHTRSGASERLAGAEGEASFDTLLGAASKRAIPNAETSAERTPPEADEPRMLPMQRFWTAPEIPATPSEYPLHPKYGVPMVSEATLNRYTYPLETLGAIPPNETGAQGDIGTSIFRVAPGGLQDFVTSDGYRHRFDVEIVFPSPSSLTWQGRDASAIHPEVADFAASSLKEKMAASGMDVSNLEISSFRMMGGTDNRPWFLDQLVLKLAGKEDRPISLNVAMRDPEYTIATLRETWGLDTGEARTIPT